MSECENLAQIEGQLSEKLLKDFPNSPKLLTVLWSKDDFELKLRNDRKLKKLFMDMSESYKAAMDFGLSIEPDKYEGFCLVNRSMSAIKPGEIQVAVGLLANLPKENSYKDWSVMEGGKLLVGVARWANHSCKANCDYYMKGGYRGRQCVRLRALMQIEHNEELTTFYNEDAFGEENVDCLCSHTEELGRSSNLVQSTSQTVVRAVKRKRLPKAEIRYAQHATEFDSFFAYYEDSSNFSLSSLNEAPSFPIETSPNNTAVPQIITSDSIDDEMGSSNGTTDESLNNAQFQFFPEYESNESSQSDTEAVRELASFNQSSLCDFVSDCRPVSVSNLALSIMSLVIKHNCSDQMMYELLKRDQIIFNGESLAPWTIKKRLGEFAAQYQCRKELLSNGEQIYLNFSPLLLKIVQNSINGMLRYAELRKTTNDIIMPKLEVIERQVTIRLILNLDGALVSKSPPKTAWPLLIAIADLPPKKRQMFQNIILGSLFVGNGTPNFDDIFDHFERQISTHEEVTLDGDRVRVKFEPIFFVADLIGKAKVLNIKKCNGYYGCSLCTQRGFHIDGAHHYPHDFDVHKNMRSPESYLENLKNLDEGSQQKLKTLNGKKSDFEKITQGVKGRSKIFSVIANQPLSSPVDTMHQLFLGVSRDLLTYFYDCMKADSKRKLNKILSGIQTPREIKRSVRSFDHLANMKASELKVHLLYLAPIVLPIFLFGEDRRSDKTDLFKLVFSLRSLYDDTRNSKFCRLLLDEFCVSMAEKNPK